jgi:addiction module HigA family antidote
VIITDVREGESALLPNKRPPTPPGEILLYEFLEPLGITQTEFARRLGIPIQRINTIINGRRAVTAETALLLAAALQTTPEFWLNLQRNHDLWHARRRFKSVVRPIRRTGS